MAWPYTEEEPPGEFRHDWKPTKAEAQNFKCRLCFSDDVWYRTWDSSDGAYTDFEYECHECKRHWWAEHSDS